MEKTVGKSVGLLLACLLLLSSFTIPAIACPPDPPPPPPCAECIDESDLPEGCYASSSTYVSFASRKLTGTEWCILSCGTTGPMYIPDISSPLPTYDDCKWKFSVSAIGNTPCVVCPEKFTEIEDACDPDINGNNYCDIVHAFSPPGPSCPPYGNSECIRKHEDGHYNDWLDCLEDEAELFAEDPSMSDMTIDCDDPDTTTCQAALATRQSAIETAVNQAWGDAAYAWNGIGETNAIAAAAGCWAALVQSICEHAESEGWDECSYCYWTACKSCEQGWPETGDNPIWIPGETPQCVKITFSGIQKPEGLPEMPDYNGEYILEQTSSPCYWEGEVDGGGVGNTLYWRDVGIGANVHLRTNAGGLIFFDSGGACETSFENEYTRHTWYHDGTAEVTWEGVECP